MASLNFACVLFLCMIAIVPIAQATITCTQVSNGVLPCVTYLRSTGASPPPANCCQGVRNLNGMAKTTPDRQAACNCLKTAASEISGLNPTLVANLPKNCGVTIPYKISTSTDCSNTIIVLFVNLYSEVRMIEQQFAAAGI
ncbi:non-specific lipid-transfer protein [Quercus suber]|uniref:Non-specific lipid-transfer protein n=1 Tax=Quercus suber TaxID=58331 RepID=A0AAW0LW05_QUESU